MTNDYAAYKEWLKTLGPGDSVVLHDYGKYTQGKVDKITASGLIRVGDEYFYPTTGMVRGHCSWGSHLHLEDPGNPATQEGMRAWEEMRFVNRVKDEMRKITLSYDQAVKIAEILKITPL